MPAAASTFGSSGTLTGQDPFGATSTLPSDRASADGLGLLVWMIGLWTVAARSAWKAVGPLDPVWRERPIANIRPMATGA